MEINFIIKILNHIEKGYEYEQILSQQRISSNKNNKRHYQEEVSRMKNVLKHKEGIHMIASLSPCEVLVKENLALKFRKDVEVELNIIIKKYEIKKIKKLYFIFFIE